MLRAFLIVRSKGYLPRTNDLTRHPAVGDRQKQEGGGGHHHHVELFASLFANKTGDATGGNISQGEHGPSRLYTILL